MIFFKNLIKGTRKIVLKLNRINTCTLRCSKDDVTHLNFLNILFINSSVDKLLLYSTQETINVISHKS